MSRQIRLLFCFVLAVNSMTGLYSQKSTGKIKITGIVTDAAQIPVRNAIIMIDSAKTNTMTDGKGFYKIKVSRENKTIAVFTTTAGIIEEALDGRKRINFTFKGLVPGQDPGEMNPANEPVNIGYQTVRKGDLNAPVGKIDGTKSRYAGYNTIYEMIRGEVPGVSVSGTKIMIRSATSVTGSTEPLFVVDGVPVNTVDNIHPRMVRSIEVLKGSAASIYGTRGSNGVILINLLKGNDK
jgi:TonB-dependent SusC/RagA subfamily outer membrane receptor